MIILGIESSCDETAAAVLRDGQVLSNIIASQIEEHKIYGGVVPEIASRRHSEAISQVVDKAVSDAGITYDDIDAVAVTFAPGLIGALLVGVNFAKGLALSLGKPLIPVHHLRSHVAANYIEFPELKPPHSFVFWFRAVTPTLLRFVTTPTLTFSAAHATMLQANVLTRRLARWDFPIPAE